MTRVLFFIAALSAPLFFPASIAIILAALASFFIPLAALSVGIWYDLLYLPGGHFPYGLMWGAIGSLVALGVRRFVETRIIGG
ncbi:hypothetical protein K2Y00_00105 [Patescibacteria group bacterium]|nr:hypothetical protein [Patescibacteria group bacterium]